MLEEYRIKEFTTEQVIEQNFAYSLYSNTYPISINKNPFYSEWFVIDSPFQYSLPPPPQHFTDVMIYLVADFCLFIGYFLTILMENFTLPNVSLTSCYNLITCLHTFSVNPRKGIFWGGGLQSVCPPPPDPVLSSLILTS